ncbi:hypothetical protein [Miniimonas sp. S16]|uniref:hypothetical protein n=1 Tax=Miniimonas sp. S16 TaxID=2171623 RepID=UPI000D527C52|nr:hypothetical protein [Miniimonas sp. S16]
MLAAARVAAGHRMPDADGGDAVGIRRAAVHRGVIAVHRGVIAVHRGVIAERRRGRRAMSVGWGMMLR